MLKETSFHFEISERKLFLRFIDVCLVLLGLHLLGSVFDFDYFILKKEKWTWALVLGVYILFFGAIFELYDLKKASSFFQTFKAIVFTASITVLIYILTPYLTPILPESRVEIIYFFITILISMSLGRIAYINCIHAPIFIKNIILIADGELLSEIEFDLYKADPNYKIQYFINTNKTDKVYSEKQIQFSELTGLANQGISEIVVTRNAKFTSPMLYRSLLNLFNKGNVIKEYAEVYEELTGKVYISAREKNFFQKFPFSQQRTKSLYRLLNRFFDIAISLIGLSFFILLYPFLLCINFFINRGPLFYTQERVGKKGKVFRIYKLRSMVVNAEANGAVWANKNDSRITPFGKFLRKSRLDEIPQFINVLLGQMSIIGPRPERPIFVSALEEALPFYPTRHIVKPGLTGWAQVNTSYGASVEESLNKLQYDLYYIKHKNFFLDLNILIKTMSTVLFFRGQ